MDHLHRSANINMPPMDTESFDSMCFLTPDTHSTSFSNTPSPLSSPVYRATANQDIQFASAFEDQRYQFSGETSYGQSQPSYSLSAPHYNPFHRRASMVVESSPSYSFPRTTSSTSSKPSKNATPALTPAEQEALPSWQRDFDKIQDATTKARWAQELYNDFLSGKIPTTGRAVHDIIDWETCVAKVDGVKDAEATARLLVAAQERKAELQTPAAKLKTIMLDKEPPRRQNKFICYRSLRSSQLASHFASFKQSQFSAITSLEWKEIDTDWWGEVANLVEEVRRAKYVGQLDTKGNPLRRGSIDSRSEEASPRSRKPKLVEKRNSVTRFDPYGDRPQRPSLPRATSYLESAPPLLAPPITSYRHSIDMGTMSGMTSQQYSPVKQEYDYSESTPFPSLSTIPHAPVTIINHGHGSTYTPAATSAMEHSLFSDPFAFTQVTPSTPSITTSSPFHTPCGPSSYTSQPYYPSPPYSHSTPNYTPQVYVPQSNWVPHGRGQTNELMEMYTLAQDFVPATGYQQGEAPCFVAGAHGGGDWSSLHPSRTIPLR